MRSDGRVLPTPAETVVLHRLGLIRSDDLPDLAARWLAADLADTESIRMLAGHDRSDPWRLDQQLSDAVAESDGVVPDDPASMQEIAVDWITSRWRHDHDTRAAVTALAFLGETHPAFDLGLFVGLNDEWNGVWGRLEPDLKAEAQEKVNRLLYRIG